MPNYFGSLAQNEKEALQIVAPLVVSVISAQNTGNVELFQGLYDDETQANLTPDDFRTAQNQLEMEYGEITSSEFIGSIKRDGYPWLMYRLTFSNSENEFVLSLILNDQVSPVKARGIWIS